MRHKIIASPLPWHFSQGTVRKPIPVAPALPMLAPDSEDIRRVISHYQKHPAIIYGQPYDIRSIEAIRNPNATRTFKGRIKKIEKKEGNPVFRPKWRDRPNPPNIPNDSPGAPTTTAASTQW